MSTAWKLALSQMSIESLNELYTRDAVSPDIHSLVGEVLKQKALQAVSVTATALAATITSISRAELNTFSITNSTIGQETPSPTNSSGQVHWQSAFWALVAIALNTCLQESGNICEINAKFGLLVKFSPIFCIVDTLTIWGQILCYLTKVPPREAIRIVARSRQQHDPDAPEESAPLKKIVGRCLLCLLAILQALKLYALRGIPWTQAFGTMYLVSYISNAVLNIMGKPQPTEHPSQPYMRRRDILPSKRVVHFFSLVAACFQTAIWTVIIRGAVSDTWLTKLASSRCRWPVDLVTALPFLPVWVALFVLYFGAIFVDFAILILPSAVVLATLDFLTKRYAPALLDFVADAFGCTVRTMRQTVAWLTGFVALVVEICFVGILPIVTAFLDSKNPLFKPVGYLFDRWERYTPYGFAFIALSLSAVVSYFLYRALFMGSMARNLGTTGYGMSSNVAWACLFMFLANVSLALLYFGHTYTPEGTWKPSWTENLGRRYL